jgi:hypothetical protein
MEGAIKVLSQRKNLDFIALMCGKISLADLPRPEIYQKLNYNNQLLPTFLEDIDEYMRCLDVIAETNHIELCDPEENIILPPKPKDTGMNLELKEQESDGGNNADLDDDDLIESESSPIGKLGQNVSFEPKLNTDMPGPFELIEPHLVVEEKIA